MDNDILKKIIAAANRELVGVREYDERSRIVRHVTRRIVGDDSDYVIYLRDAFRHYSLIDINVHVTRKQQKPGRNTLMRDAYINERFQAGHGGMGD